MQTFLPYADFDKSAQSLDRQRLGKQRVEAFQIYKALHDKSYGWQNHPAVKMWRGYPLALNEYYKAVVRQWIHRGYVHNMPMSLVESSDQVVYPQWVGFEEFHSSHRSALSFKYPEWYSKQWNDKPQLNYYWPTSNGR